MDTINKVKLKDFSNQYYKSVDEFVNSDFEHNKVLGKFYTNISIAEDLVDDIITVFSEDNIKELNIIDPFCGDGRLIKLLILKMNELDNYKGCRYNVTLWDVDSKAVEMAKNTLDCIAMDLKIEISVRAEIADAFVLYASEINNYDICITNPPWGLLKPQKIFSDRFGSKEIEKYKDSIALYDEYMKHEFCLSQPTRRFGRWGTNLGRCGVEVALRLINKNGLCGLVSPASLFNDRVSVPFREWIFEQHKIYTISYFPAELKLYGTADVSSITTLIGNGCTNSTFKIRIYDLEQRFVEQRLTQQDYLYIKRNQYALPLEYGIDKIGILRHLESLPTVLEYCEKNNLNFVRELDETRVSEKLQKSGKIVFAKGYMVDRFKFESDGLYLNEVVFTPPKSSNFPKLVWRDVSRNSQKRRIKATILAANHIAGNSLGVISTCDDSKFDSLKILLAIMNSIVFEFQARSHLVSNHVSSGIIKQVRIPKIETDDYLIGLVDKMLNGQETEWLLEAYVASLYGITEEQFMSIVQGFDFCEDEVILLKQAIKEIYNRK